MKRYVSKFKEAGDNLFNGRKVNGLIFNANSLNVLLKEGLIDWMLDLGGDSGFSPIGIEEMHIYNPYDSMEGIKKLTDLNYPEASVKNNMIHLYSAFGFGKEDEVLCKKVKINIAG